MKLATSKKGNTKRSKLLFGSAQAPTFLLGVLMKKKKLLTIKGSLQKQGVFKLSNHHFFRSGENQ